MRVIAVIKHDYGGAEIHESKGDRAPGAAGADQHHGCRLGTGAAEPLLEIAAKAAPVGVVAGGAAVGRNGDGVDGADLCRFAVDLVQQRQHVLLERKRHVGAGKARGLDRIEQLRQATSLEHVDIHQMIIAVDAGGGESIDVQRRRQRLHDICADQADQTPCDRS